MQYKLRRFYIGFARVEKLAIQIESIVCQRIVYEKPYTTFLAPNTTTTAILLFDF